MIFFSFGPPSAFTVWCETVLIELARRKFGVVEFINANTLEDLGTNIIKTAASHVVCGSRLPSYRLSKLIMDTKTPFLFIHDEPRSAVAHLAINGADTLNATRVVATGCASLMQCAGLPGALQLEPGVHLPDPLETVGSINAHFDLAISDSDLEEIAESLSSEHDAAGQHAIKAWWENLDDATQRLINGATDAYPAYFVDQRMGLITWHRELFVATDTQQPVTHPIDLTGRGRCLVYGPYIDLPPGSWVVRVVLGCSQDALNLGLIIDACSTGIQLCEARIRPRPGTVFEVALKFEIKESDSNPIEIRIFSERAAIEGLLGLSHVSLSREQEIHVTKDAALSAELGLAAS